jgi:hypothetical protein
MSQQSPRTRPPARRVSDQAPPPPPPAPKKRTANDGGSSPRERDRGYSERDRGYDRDRGYSGRDRERGYNDRDRGYGGRGGNVPPRRTGRGYEAPPRRDMFPILMGGLVGALVVGLMVLVYLLLSNNTGTPQPGPISGTQPTQAPGTTSDAPAPPAGDAPRMTIDEFKALYDDPAKRPIILDVRAKEAFDEGHIAGAISFPEADVATRIGELPKDKMIVAYCQ